MHFCDTDSRGLLMITFLGKIFSFAKIIIPIVLILMGTIDLIKAIAASDEKVKETQKLLTKRVIIGVSIFLIPTLVLFILKVLNQEETRCLYCFLSPYEDTCEYIKPKRKVPVIEQPKKEEPQQEEKQETVEDPNTEENIETPVDPETCKVQFSGAFCINNNTESFKYYRDRLDFIFDDSIYSDILKSGTYIFNEKNSNEFKYLNDSISTTLDSLAINSNTNLKIYLNDELVFDETGPLFIVSSAEPKDYLPTCLSNPVWDNFPDDVNKRINKDFSKSVVKSSDEFSFDLFNYFKYFSNIDYIDSGYYGDEGKFVISCVK